MLSKLFKSEIKLENPDKILENKFCFWTFDDTLRISYNRKNLPIGKILGNEGQPDYKELLFKQKHSLLIQIRFSIQKIQTLNMSNFIPKYLLIRSICEF